MCEPEARETIAQDGRRSSEPFFMFSILAASWNRLPGH